MSDSIKKPKIIVICGPTATGKSDYAVALAQRISYEMSTLDMTAFRTFAHNTIPSTGEGTIESVKSQVPCASNILPLGALRCEIISADSRQIYRYLDIGTGKITHDEMSGIPHHLLDIREPLEAYSVIDYKKDCEIAIKEILARGHIPILCGGTGFYIDAVILGVTLPDVPPNESLRKELESLGQDDLEKRFEYLWDTALLDHGQKPISIDKKNPRRLMRAIEILTALGHIPAVESNPPYDVFHIGLDADDETLKDRIRKRIEKRLIEKQLEISPVDSPNHSASSTTDRPSDMSNMIAESEALITNGKLNHERMNKLGLEYAFISDYIKLKNNIPQDHANPDDEITSFDVFKEKLFYAIWHYAKRQRTWFRRNKDIQWIPNLQSDKSLKSAQEIESRLFDWLAL